MNRVMLVEDEENNSEEKRMAGSDETTNAAQKQKEVLPETKAQELPEGVDKLIKFMEETGGDVQDYARLNADYSNVDKDTGFKKKYDFALEVLNNDIFPNCKTNSQKI